MIDYSAYDDYCILINKALVEEVLKNHKLQDQIYELQKEIECLKLSMNN